MDAALQSRWQCDTKNWRELSWAGDEEDWYQGGWDRRRSQKKNKSTQIFSFNPHLTYSPFKPKGRRILRSERVVTGRRKEAQKIKTSCQWYKRREDKNWKKRERRTRGKGRGYDNKEWKRRWIPQCKNERQTDRQIDRFRVSRCQFRSGQTKSIRAMSMPMPASVRLSCLPQGLRLNKGISKPERGSRGGRREMKKEKITKKKREEQMQ